MGNIELDRFYFFSYARIGFLKELLKRLGSLFNPEKLTRCDINHLIRMVIPCARLIVSNFQISC